MGEWAVERDTGLRYSQLSVLALCHNGLVGLTKICCLQKNFKIGASGRVGGGKRHRSEVQPTQCSCTVSQWASGAQKNILPSKKFQNLGQWASGQRKETQVTCSHFCVAAQWYNGLVGLRKIYSLQKIFNIRASGRVGRERRDKSGMQPTQCYCTAAQWASGVHPNLWTSKKISKSTLKCTVALCGRGLRKIEVLCK